MSEQEAVVDPVSVDVEATAAVLAHGAEQTAQALSGVAEAQQQAVLAVSEADATAAVVEARRATQVAAGRLVPVEIRGVDLLIQLRVSNALADKLGEVQELLGKLREKFGQDALLEQLSVLLCGEVEKVTLSRPQPETKPMFVSTVQQQPVQQQAPVQVVVPQEPPRTQYGAYQIESRSCPWTGNALSQLDPRSIYDAISNPTKSQLMTAQDLSMMQAYYMEWYQAQQQPQTVPPQPALAQDNVIW